VAATALNLLALILLLLGAALIGLLLAARWRARPDRCLQAFDGYFVSVEGQEGRQAAGVLRLSATGFELAAAGGGEDPGAEPRSLHFAVAYPHIQRIWRDVGMLGARERSRRLHDRERLLQRRSPWSRRCDQGLDALAALSGRGPQVQGRVAAHPARVAWPDPLIGYAGNRFDPLLEASLGQRVLCQLLLDGVLYERAGVLAAYSPDFLLLFDVPFPQPARITLAPGAEPRQEGGLRLQLTGRHLQIDNLTPYPLLLDTLRAGDAVKELGILLPPQEQLGLNLDGIGACEIAFQSVREIDLLAPRRNAILRQRADVGQDGLFAVGVALTGDENDQAQEERLRWELRQHPHNAAAAASLARLLSRRGALAEAEEWFRQALTLAQAQPRALADGGQRVANELAELQRRHPRLGGGS